MARRATAQDVARRAGVSRSAVSLVLNGHGDGNVAKPSQQRILAAARRGLDVPGDVSIVGYDDERRIASDTVPALTTVALPLREIGEQAMDAVLVGAGVDDPTLPPRPTGRVLIPCRLVERASSGPVSS